MTNFTDLQTKRRSIYALGKDVEPFKSRID